MEARVAGQSDRFRKVDSNGERQMEQTARRRAYRLGVVEVTRVAADQHSVSSEGVGTSDHRAEVSGIANLITKNHQPRVALERFMSRDVDHLTHRTQTLRGYRRCQLGNGTSRGPRYRS